MVGLDGAGGHLLFDPEKVAELLEQGGQTHRLPPRVRHALGGSIEGNEPGVNGEGRSWRGRGGRGLRGPAVRVRVRTLGAGADWAPLSEAEGQGVSFITSMEVVIFRTRRRRSDREGGNMDPQRIHKGIALEGVSVRRYSSLLARCQRLSVREDTVRREVPQPVGH